MKYKIHVSKGWLEVEWNDSIIVEADNRKKAEELVLEMAKSGTIDWYKTTSNEDANYQIEDVREIGN